MDNKIKQIPTKPGVYFFKNEDETIIYIGKAKNLRNRVRSYFQQRKHQSAKNISMIKRITDVEWLVVRSEVEALLTEANLIKKHQPHYNVSLKDDKSFPYIRITKEPYPRVFITRNIIRDGSKYFGPYTDVMHLRRSLKAVHKIFPVRSCDYLINNESIKAKKVSLCLDYHIKKCQGPCEGVVSEKSYADMIKHVIQFLQGRTKETEVFIKNHMELASSEMRFEDAGMYRDQLHAIGRFKDRQRKVTADFEDRDVIALAKEEDYGIAVIVRIRNGRITSREKLSLRNLDESDAKIMETIVSRFYLETDFIPKEVSLPVAPENQDELISWLKEKRNGAIHLSVPKKGEKAKEVRLAFQNAKLLLGEWMINRKKRRELVPKMISQLQDDLQMKVPPRRIEAFDISHLGGTNTVASMVCFMDGKPRKSEYRKFKVKTVDGIDDFASMREVVFRRYKRVKEEGIGLPDLILIDGGKGQLSMAVSALRELGLDYLPIIGLAKRLEEVFVPGQSEAQSIHKQSPGLILLRRIRDEAHRFAITYQKQKRTDSVTKSIFHELPGMGEKRVQKLLSEYKSIKKISELKPEQIQNALGFPDLIAQSIIELAKDSVSS
ncbi:MAG: excinuclease ABC subunit C [Candidatus Marinimicrobia bacterium]|jgi:excinuclease ABC subunit C|nr:excinuclease ABC subunit C [Candidatus Neomarinimicrobiota bacterium]MBT7083482.1 excinuclease ABC subunit C [Candidatus Neomarinimicrobiota bacterium]MCP4931877.1 excinuclease ABC subunit C [Candidatus Neomarinimicrobiota bacterium]MDP6033982.1 excinuclease ABC subunit UvrC [Candidatus Neomarinimicrobiota bacterium]MDP6202164.1 excinuclease ABC subunit UvrC [Candidatus Neomarinimicrobiota bacterium]|tara:strand:+ start:3035 stop:4855 length:1821 start_codon:yes stop_codon:yes gene_type:complete